MMRLFRPTYVVLALMLGLLWGCGPSEPAGDPEALVVVFQRQADPMQIKASADEVADFLSRELGMPVQAFVPTDYSATVQAMVSGRADVAYLSAVPFLLARRDAGATLLLAEERVDAQGTPRSDYDSVLVVRQDSPLENIDDLIANASEIRMVFTSPTSTSGFVMPYRRFVNEGLIQPGQSVQSELQRAFRSHAYGGSYALALQQVINGQGDVAAVSFYTVEGDSALRYLQPEELAQLRILARTPGVPTHLICVRGGLSDELTGRIRTALLKLSSERPELLAEVYGARALVEVDENEHVSAAVEALEYLGLPIDGFVR